MLACEQIRKNDEHWRDNLIGCSFNKKLENAIMERFGLENQLERINKQKDLITEKLHGKKRVTLLPSLYENAVVSCLNKKRKILDIGFNTADDMNLANWGTFLAGIIHAPTAYANSGYCTISLNNLSNTARTITMYTNYGNASSPSTYTFNAGYQTMIMATALGSLLQFGSGSTAATRTDYKIQTALGTAPENGQFGSGTAAYGGGSISFSGAISAGGAGTVNEMGWFLSLIYGAPTNAINFDTFMMFHDILSSGVAYSAGNTLNGSYAISM